MVNFAPPTVVEPIERVALPYGLFSVVSPRGAWLTGEDNEADQKWVNGTEWIPLTCAPASGIGEPDCETDEDGNTVAVGLPKSFAGIPLGDASGFVVYGSDVCSPVGNTPDEAQARATAHLLAREEARAEQALWTGDLGNTPNLAADATDLTGGGGALDPVTALALLENFIAREYGSLGVIHVTRGGLIALGQWDLITTSGSQARTLVGTPVVAGAGYPGTSPEGEDPATGTEWAYASPAIVGYRSGVFPSSDIPGDLLDRNVNDMYAVAERNYLLMYDPCGVGAVNFTLNASGTP